MILSLSGGWLLDILRQSFRTSTSTPASLQLPQIEQWEKHSCTRNGWRYSRLRLGLAFAEGSGIDRDGGAGRPGGISLRRMGKKVRGEMCWTCGPVNRRTVENSADAHR